jgi:hypothetical protein
VSRVLRVPSSSRSPDHDTHRTIYYLGYPLGRFAGLKHRQLARQVGVIITTGRILRTLVNKINLLVDSPRSIEASRLALVKAESIFLCRASGCFGTSRGSSCRSSSTSPPRAGSSAATPPRAGSSSTTSPPPLVWVPRNVTRLVARLIPRLVAPLVVDYSASRKLVVDYSASRRLVVNFSASRRLVVDNSASRRLLIDYFASAVRPGASARRAAHHAACRAARRRLLRLTQALRRLLRLAQARRRQLHLAQACRRLLRLRRASGCLGTSRGSSRGSSRHSWSTSPPRTGSSSTTSPPPRVWVPRHVARLVTQLVAPLVVDFSASRRLVVDYSASRRLLVDNSTSRRLVVDFFASVVRPGASARRAARHAARRAARSRLLHLAQARRRLLHRASGCLGTSRGSSRGSSRRSSSTTPPRPGSSSTTPPRVRVPRHVVRLVTQLVAPLVVDYSASPRLIIDYFASAARLGASARRAARHAAHRRLLRLRRASGCLGTSCGLSRGSSSTTPCAATSSCGHAGSTSATPCVVTTCLAATLARLRARRTPP